MEAKKNEKKFIEEHAVKVQAPKPVQIKKQPAPAKAIARNGDMTESEINS